MLSINTLPGFNAPALEAANQRSRIAVERISALRRLNSAQDDAAGIALAERLSAVIRGDEAAQRAVADGQSLTETADGAADQVQARMQRMRELALQAGNGTLNASDRRSLDQEYRQLGAEVQRTLGGTRFNGKAVLGDDAGRFTQSAGAAPDQTVSVDTRDLRQDPAVSAASQGHIDTPAAATAQVRALDQAQDAAADLRASLGAAGARLAATADSLSQQSLSASRSAGALVDANVAQEVAALRRAQAAQYAAVQQMLQMGQSRRGALLALLA